MDIYTALPEPAKSGIVGALSGAAGAYAMGEGDSLMSYSISYGALTAAAAYFAPMLTADPMMQLGAAAAVGAGSQMLLPTYVPGGAVMAAAVPAASIYVSRMAS